MRIYANGCSFTYGDELLIPKKSSWPILLGQQLGASITNDAASGGTNQRTLYKTIKHLAEDFDLYIIAWTFTSRYTFYRAENNFEVNFNPQLANTLYGADSNYAVWGKTLYTIYYNELYAFKLWLQQILQMQSVLKLNSKKYIMLNTAHNNLSSWTSPQFISAVKHLVNFELMTDQQLLDEQHEILCYINQIDFDNFYRWGGFALTDLTKEFNTGPGGHFLEDGHEHVSKLLVNHIKENYQVT